MRAATMVSLCVVLAGVAAGGCDWRDFDKQADNTPVLQVGAPPKFGAVNDFGRVVTPLPPPGDGRVAARYVVSAVGMPAVGFIDLDTAGRPTGHTVDSSVLTEGDAYPVTSLAVLPGQQKLFMGAAQPAGGRLYLMTVGTPPTLTLFDASTAEERFGLGVAVANLVGAEAPELIAVSNDFVTVYVDGAATNKVISASLDPCTISLPSELESRYRVSRAVVTGKLLPGGGTQIAVGTPTASGKGSVAILSVDAGGTINCLQALQGNEPRFGQALATGDFDADGNTDLLVGAPPDHAYLFKGPLGPAPTPIAITLTGSAGQFGGAVAAANIDGKPGDEALISDADASVKGKQAAGTVIIYSGATLAMKLATLAEHDPDTNDVYGASVNGLPFCTSGCAAGELRQLPLVGANAATFTYFLLSPTDTDPRRR